MVKRPLGDLDVLLMEGPLSAGRGQTKGLHFVWTSSQNIDRLVTIFRAATRTGRVLLIDLYTAVVLEATGRDSIPQSDWDDVRFYIPQRQRVTLRMLSPSKHGCFTQRASRSRFNSSDSRLDIIIARAADAETVRSRRDPDPAVRCCLSHVR